MSNKKINKRTIFVTEFTVKETKSLNKLVKMTGTTKASVIRALVRRGLQVTVPNNYATESELMSLIKLGRMTVRN